MSDYTAYMLAVGFIVVALRMIEVRFINWERDVTGAGWLLLACIPFFAVPGLSDIPYMPFEANSAIVGGFMAAVVAFFMFRGSTAIWHVLVAMLLTGMVFWNSARAFGGLPQSTHAIGLEAVFYLIMLVGFTSLFVSADSFPRPLAALGRKLAHLSWRGVE